jgi:hypothetical protein
MCMCGSLSELGPSYRLSTRKHGNSNAARPYGTGISALTVNASNKGLESQTPRRGPPGHFKESLYAHEAIEQPHDVTFVVPRYSTWKSETCSRC